MKLWVRCLNASGTRTLKEGKKYLGQVRGTRIKIIICEDNPHFVIGKWYNKDRFETVKPKNNLGSVIEISLDEAEDIVKKFQETYPHVKVFIDKPYTARTVKPKEKK